MTSDAYIKMVVEGTGSVDHKTKVMLPIYTWLYDNPPSRHNPVRGGMIAADGVPVAQDFDHPDKRKQYRHQIALWYNGLYFVAHGETLEQATEQMILKLEFGDGQPPLEEKPVEKGQGRLL